ncbi:MAG: replicative DNA helicase [Gracilibacteraceae bacterium]|jgi:replicative DNA helicase|nr:replicative DNA helicase [Gracilibacteraceae bacterium]
MENPKIPPHHLEAEQAILGSLLLDAKRAGVVFESLRPEDFYRDNHRLIFAAIAEIYDRGEPCDLVTVTEQLSKAGALERIGGMAAVAQIAQSVPSAAHAEYYAQIVVEKSLLRELLRLAQFVQEQGYRPEKEARELLDEAERQLLDIAQRQTRKNFAVMRELLQETIDKIEYLFEHRGTLTGVPSHFRDLDRITSGWQASDLIIIAARPSMGKTALALNMIQHAALKSQKKVALFSLEMSREQLVQRMLCSESMVDQQKVRTGELTDDDWRRLTGAQALLDAAEIYIDDAVGVTLGDLRSKARRLQLELEQKKERLELIVIDYLQQMALGRRAENRQQEVAQISRGLKALARELKTPVIALSQLNRGVEARQEKRPVMSDLLESGSIEADADVVAFIYRDEYYNPDSDKKGIAEIIIAKHRNGPVGTVELGFLKEFTKFVDLSKR